MFVSRFLFKATDRLLTADNPIFRRELVYHQRVFGRGWRIMQALLILAAIGTVVANLVNKRIPAYFPIELLSAWAFHIAFSVGIIIECANVLSREFADQNWETLMLTGISARKILFGKFRATLFRLRGWILSLIGVRLALMIMLTLHESYQYSYSGGRRLELIAVLLALLSLVAIPLISILEVACCTALSLAGSALVHNRAGAAFLATVLRFTPTVFFAYAVIANRYGSGFWAYTLYGLADGGFVPSVLMMLGNRSDIQLQIAGLPAFMISTGFLCAILAVSLLSALRFLRHGGASPEQ